MSSVLWFLAGILIQFWFKSCLGNAVQRLRGPIHLKRTADNSLLVITCKKRRCCSSTHLVKPRIIASYTVWAFKSSARSCVLELIIQPFGPPGYRKHWQYEHEGSANYIAALFIWPGSEQPLPWIKVDRFMHTSVPLRIRRMGEMHDNYMNTYLHHWTHRGFDKCITIPNDAIFELSSMVIFQLLM